MSVIPFPVKRRMVAVCECGEQWPCGDFESFCRFMFSPAHGHLPGCVTFHCPCGESLGADFGSASLDCDGLTVWLNFHISEHSL